MLLLDAALLLAVVHAASAVATLRPMPDYIKICSRDDPRLDACVTNTVEKLRPLLKHGIPDLLVPSLEPLELGDMVALRGAGLTLRMYNVNASECSDFTITDMRVDLQNNRISFRLHFPRLRVAARYEVDGRILLLPLSGSGPFNGNFTRCIGEVTMTTREANNKFLVDKMDIKVTVGGGRVVLSNLFGGDPTLGGVINGVINSNFESVVSEVIPSIERALSGKMVEIARRVVAEFTFDQLFPPKN